MDLEKTINDLSIKYGLDPLDIKTRYSKYKESALFKEEDSIKFLETACSDLLLMKMFDTKSSIQKDTKHTK